MFIQSRHLRIPLFTMIRYVTKKDEGRNNERRRLLKGEGTKDDEREVTIRNL